MASDYKTINIAYGQTLVDIALQEYGCYEGIFQLLQDNETTLTSGIDTTITPGMALKILANVPDLNSNNKQIAEYLNTNKIEVSSVTSTEAILEEIPTPP